MPASQAGRRGFESHRPLHFLRCDPTNLFSPPILTRPFTLWFFFALALFSPHFLKAQTAPDNSSAVLFPSGEEDSIALPYAIQVLDRQEGLTSISGLLSTQVGWPDDLGRGREGFGVAAPGLLFEGIAYPLQSREIFNWMPALGPLELLNLPAQAWWGPESSSGAVQIREPRFSDQSSGQFTAWGGTGALGGLTGQYSDSALAIASNIRRSPWTDSSNVVQSALGLEAKIQFLTDDVWDLSSGFLGFQNGDGENWAAWVGDFQWSDQNFQTLRLRPFLKRRNRKATAPKRQGLIWIMI